MDNLLQKILSGNKVVPPGNISKQLENLFPDSINAEWCKKDNGFEAVFYKDNVEYIASFTKEGILKEYKVYLPEDLLPELIKSTTTKKGEIMNIVMINSGNTVTYEIIIRDQQLKRSVLFFNSFGTLMKEKDL